MAFYALLGLFAGGLLVLALALRRPRKKAPKAKQPTPEEAELRKKREQELLDRLRRIKDGSHRVADAIERDPVRAAKVVRTMMRDKGDK